MKKCTGRKTHNLSGTLISVIAAIAQRSREKKDMIMLFIGVSVSDESLNAVSVKRKLAPHLPKTRQRNIRGAKRDDTTEVTNISGI